MNRQIFRGLTALRLSDARVLLKTGRNASGAYYLAGYAVECALKACIAKKTKKGDWPPSPEEARKLYTHDLVLLIEQAGLKLDLNTQLKNTAFAASWGVVKEWSEKDRYRNHTQAEAKALYEAITDPSNGVLPWVQGYW